MFGTFTIGRIFGIRVAVHTSWFAIYALVVWSVSAVFTGISREMALLAAASYGIVLFASLIVHEFAHALVARSFGVRTRVITLFLFGGVASLEREPPTPRAEVLVAVAGPLASFALAAIFGAVAYAAYALPVPSTLADLALLAAIGNAGIGVFNLIPAYPMDGGRVLHALVWRVRRSRAAATAAASLAGVWLAAIVVCASVVMLVTTREWRFGWYATIGMFVLITSYRTFADARAVRRYERMLAA
jgi:Zn-dependent protease